MSLNANGPAVAAKFVCSAPSKIDAPPSRGKRVSTARASSAVGIVVACKGAGCVGEANDSGSKDKTRLEKHFDGSDIESSYG